MSHKTRLLWTVLSLLVVGGGIVLMMHYPSSNAQSSNQGSTSFATGRGGADSSATFDAQRAFNYLRQICAIGPRISGTEGMKKQIAMVKKHFEAQGAQVELQTFQAKQRSRPQAVEMTNLIARWHPERKRRIMVCTHYDTRPIADQEPNPRDWTKPFVGANDGASGVAVMMELAHHVAALELKVGLDFVLFDGEEYIFDKRPSEEGGDRYFFGSDHFADEYAKARRQNPGGMEYLEAILLDMVAGKNAKFLYEGHSAMSAGRLVEKIWNIAKELDCKAFVPSWGQDVLDDHLALLRVGIPAVDIVPSAPRNRHILPGREADFMDYPHWHRLSDIPENCSPDTMDQVGRVLMTWMRRAF